MELRSSLRPETLLIVNDRLDVALLAGADGVQLGEAGLPVAEARRVAPERFLLGRSVHSVDGAIRAAEDGAGYLLAGTIFPSRSHPGGGTHGTELIRAIRARTGLPLIAIGGINASNVADVMDAGADGVAVISAVLGESNPWQSASALARLAG